ncbi:peptidase M20 domain-containing protein 2-like [Sycon ciliatum]|uniref:peptidase M20 domain-containing protein 2-like n=1 Tax=Sycon ciliatum TaxID=27933 RepID=UPI0031F63CE0
MSQATDVISKAVEDKADSLQELSGKIWSHPELFFEEKFAHDTLTEFLEKNGFEVERKYKVDTAFKAVFRQGSGGANIGLICEYDALPDIGHACGHNLIAESGAAAAIGLKAALEASPATSGTVTLLGTPAEESGGGKILLINAGAFVDIDVCLMVHPAAMNMMATGCLSCMAGNVVFTGKAAHASAAPWDGINALDAVINAYTALSTLRQQIHTNWRINVIITEGGVKPNIIPEKAALAFSLRAPTDKELAVLKGKLADIVKAAALATGCEVDLQFAVDDRIAYYSNMIPNKQLVERYRQHWLSFGPADSTITPDHFWASTDMGNVSLEVPSIQPTFNIGTAADVHTRDFTETTNQPKAHAATRCVSKAMAAVGWDVLTDSALLKEIKESFQQQLASLNE